MNIRDVRQQMPLTREQRNGVLAAFLTAAAAAGFRLRIRPERELMTHSAKVRGSCWIIREECEFTSDEPFAAILRLTRRTGAFLHIGERTLEAARADDARLEWLLQYIIAALRDLHDYRALPVTA